MSGDKKVLVYQYHADKHPVLSKNPDVITQEKLDDIVKKNSNLQQSSKALKRTDLSVEIKEHDLLTQTQKNSSIYNTKPNYDANVASVNVPKEALAKNVVSGAYTELIILSPKRDNK